MPDTPRLVAPFVAERYAKLEQLSELIAPPYDVIGPSLRATLEGRHPRNVVRLTLPEGDGDRYEAARALLAAWRADGTLVSDAEPALYVLRQAFVTPTGESHVRTGLLAAVEVEPYTGGRVRPHEKTHRGPKEDRLSLMRATGTMFEALFLLAPDPGETLKNALARATAGPPMAEAELDGVGLTLWSVTGDEGATLAELAGAHALYIADGHHRFETAVAFRGEKAEATRTLALIVPRSDPGLVVLPTFRLVEGAQLTDAALRELLGEACLVEALPAGEDPVAVARELEGGCVVCLPDGAYLISERSDSTLPRLTVNLDPAVQRLNVARVDALVVHPIRKASGGAVTYTADPDEVLAVAERGGAGVLLPATPVEEVIAVADAGAFMPQKSTYFQPKVPSGLIMMPVVGQ